MNDEQVIGLPVIGIDDGQELGTVQHAYLDPEKRRVIVFGVLPTEETPDAVPGALEPSGAAFLVMPRALSYLATDEVRSLGADAVMVADASTLRDDPPATETGQLVALDALDGRSVVTTSGAAVGAMTSVAFDPNTFALTAIEVVPDLVRHRTSIPASLIVDLTSDPIVVGDDADPAALQSRQAEAEEEINVADDEPSPGTTIIAPRREPVGIPPADDRLPRHQAAKSQRPPRGERRRKKKKA